MRPSDCLQPPPSIPSLASGQPLQLGFCEASQICSVFGRSLFTLLAHCGMSSLGTSKGILEIAKFALYVTVPITLMYTFANNTKNLQKVMGNRSYVVYPPEGPLPPSPEEIREMAREIARNRNNNNNVSS